MSHPQPTPQDDDQTPKTIQGLRPLVIEDLAEGQEIIIKVNGGYKRMRVKSVDRDGDSATATVAPVELDDSKVPSWAEMLHAGRLGAAPKLPNATDNQVINPTLIESIAQWLGERESTHLWPEIHESDKAC